MSFLKQEQIQSFGTRQQAISEIKLLVKGYISMLKDFGIQCSPVSKYTLDCFKELPLERQNQIILSFQNQRNFLTAVKESGFNFKDNQKILRQFTKSENVNISDDFINSLGENDVIEVYNSSVEQVFRNLKFLEYSSYDPLALETVPWFVLYARDASITKKIASTAMHIMKNPEIGHMQPDVPVHILEERNSPEKRILEINFKKVAVITDNDQQTLGLICASDVSDFGNNKDDYFQFLRQ